MNTEQLLEKTIDTTALASGGLLNTQQYDKFVDLVVDQSVMLKQARVVKMRSAVTEIDKIATAGRVSQLKSEGVAPATLSKPNFGKITLTSTGIITPFEMTFEAMEDNIAGKSIEDAIIAAMAKQTATDLEELAIQGDTDLEDGYLEGLDGWRKLANDGHVVNFKGEKLDKAGLSSLFRALPNQYKRAYGDLRFFCAPTSAQDWHDTFADRGTAAADQSLTSGQLPPYMGVAIVPVPQIATDCAAIAPYAGTDTYSYTMLTPRENLIFGIQSEVRIEKDKDIMRGVNQYAITTRIAVALENTDAVVIGVNISTGN